MGGRGDQLKKRKDAMKVYEADLETDFSYDDRNANKGTPRGRGMIERSISKLGAGRSLVADKNGKIVAGNKTREALAGAKMRRAIVVETDGTTPVIVKRTDWDLDERNGPAREYAYADNRIAEMDLDWDLSVVADDVAAGVDLSVAFSDDDLQDLLGTETESKDVDAEPQISRADELRKKWNVESGQLWLLGEHRLLCGDSTKLEDVDRVMAGEMCDICFTSPPYNVGNNSLGGNKSMVDSKYQHSTDDLPMSEYLSLLCGFTDAALICCRFVVVNLQQLSGNKIAILEWAYHYRDRFADRAVWFKGHGQPAMARNVMNSRFEDVWILSAKVGATRAIDTGDFRGTVSNVHEGGGQSSENVDAGSHAATMPLHLARWAVDNFSSSSVYEPFSGSGTTIIACEQLGRKCRAIEISPGYVAVALQRFNDATGNTPTLEVNGL